MEFTVLPLTITKSAGIGNWVAGVKLAANGAHIRNIHLHSCLHMHTHLLDLLYPYLPPTFPLRYPYFTLLYPTLPPIVPHILPLLYPYFTPTLPLFYPYFTPILPLFTPVLPVLQLTITKSAGIGNWVAGVKLAANGTPLELILFAVELILRKHGTVCSYCKDMRSFLMCEMHR